MVGGIRAVTLALALTAGIATAGCSSTEDDAASKKDNADRIPLKETVSITQSGPNPRKARIRTGGSIIFVNRDPTGGPHTAQTEGDAYKHMPGGQDSSFDTHTLSWEEPYTVVFHTPGIYRYSSSYDDWEAKVEVVTRPLPTR